MRCGRDVRLQRHAAKKFVKRQRHPHQRGHAPRRGDRAFGQVDKNGCILIIRENHPSQPQSTENIKAHPPNRIKDNPTPQTHQSGKGQCLQDRPDPQHRHDDLGRRQRQRTGLRRCALRAADQSRRDQQPPARTGEQNDAKDKKRQRTGQLLARLPELRVAGQAFGDLTLNVARETCRRGNGVGPVAGIERRDAALEQFRRLTLANDPVDFTDQTVGAVVSLLCGKNRRARFGKLRVELDPAGGHFGGLRSAIRGHIAERRYLAFDRVYAALACVLCGQRTGSEIA